ncbi:hypothetical protein P3T76_006005 [Phytophthora citrophthora]|uniref:RxLR effector protein n=1 Tax=Phytophthora citrophthora TaxID=4793 RepID=A0AAD9GQB8_9STRA|nr:hypothetical protein P3T76_006005 [Phytophthora citrophthora]
MQVFRFLAVAAIAVMTFDMVSSVPQEDSNTAEEVSNDALDVILGASSKTGSATIAGAKDTASGSNSASSAGVAGLFTVAMAATAALIV